MTRWSAMSVVEDHHSTCISHFSESSNSLWSFGDQVYWWLLKRFADARRLADSSLALVVLSCGITSDEQLVRLLHQHQGIQEHNQICIIIVQDCGQSAMWQNPLLLPLHMYNLVVMCGQRKLTCCAPRTFAF